MKAQATLFALVVLFVAATLTRRASDTAIVWGKDRHHVLTRGDDPTVQQWNHDHCPVCQGQDQ